MEIRLIYKGQLLATGNDRLKPVNPARDQDIHRIRRVIHRQLAVLWDKHPVLAAKRDKYYQWSTDWKQANHYSGIMFSAEEAQQRRADARSGFDLFTEIEALANRFNKCGFSFVPLVNDVFNVVCGLEILFLRREDPGQLITTQTGGDIDGRLKTLFEALQIPTSCTQIDGTPDRDETPFYVLLQDDGLITDVQVTTDRLLEPVGPNEKQNDVVLIIKAQIKTSQAWFTPETPLVDTNEPS